MHQTNSDSGAISFQDSAEEGSDQKAHDLLIRDGSAVRIGGVPGSESPVEPWWNHGGTMEFRGTLW